LPTGQVKLGPAANGVSMPTTAGVGHSTEEEVETDPDVCLSNDFHWKLWRG
jgi:hypothetical protein